mmetsp:Transcript_31038/g.53402  ORF Transcript_31038/g.53402 Transcript_31038/m.53402 type:complete len:235 (+) Transcript_31038:415-1119(+)
MPNGAHSFVNAPFSELRPGVFRRQWVGLAAVPQVDLCPQGLMHAFYDANEAHEAKHFCAASKLMVGSSSRPCHIISIGSNNQWGFETSIFRQTNCTVDTLDCTGEGKRWKPPAEISSRVRLRNICLGSGAKGEQTRYKSWTEMTKILNLTTAPVWLKMDCEGCELTVLPALVKAAREGSLLPDQISLEVHFGTGSSAPQVKEGAGQLTPIETASRFYKELYSYGGYAFSPHADG